MGRWTPCVIVVNHPLLRKGWGDDVSENLCTTFSRLGGRAGLDKTMVPGDRLLQRYIKARKRLNAYEGIDENMELQVR